jgi:hypothetical protein
VGTPFPTYRAMVAAVIHGDLRKGIHGRQDVGATAVLNGGYPDDQDDGAEVIYTGRGGQDQAHHHVADQVMQGENLALAHNVERGLPVRVIRGRKANTAFSPTWVSLRRPLRCHALTEDRPPVASLPDVPLSAGTDPLGNPGSGIGQP